MPYPTVDGLRTLEIGTRPAPCDKRLNQAHTRRPQNVPPRDCWLTTCERTEELETEGDLLALVDDDSQHISTVTVVRVETMPFIEVPWSFAQAEGEGDESLEEWRDGHRRFWTEAGEAVDDHTPVVLIWFEIVTK